MRQEIEKKPVNRGNGREKRNSEKEREMKGLSGAVTKINSKR